ncbi:MAG: hypothetical protein ABIZ04_22090 [Opitutus sp.]
MTKHELSDVRGELSRSRSASFSSQWRRYTCWTMLLMVGASWLRADPVERDAGEGVRYLRSHVLPADLPSAEVKNGSMILDLRYTTAEPEAATALDAWLKFRAQPHTPVIILVNSETAAVLRESLVRWAKHPNVITVGHQNPETAPDISVAANPDDEKKAYDALEHGSSIAALITENADKPRVDEASIMRSRSESGGALADASVLDDLPPDGKKVPSTPPPLIDRVLQRAVHLHRALQALRRP